MFKIKSYRFILLFLAGVFPLILRAGNGDPALLKDSILQSLRLRSHLLIYPDELNSSRVDSLIEKRVPLAILNPGNTNDALKRLQSRYPDEIRPLVIISGTDSVAPTPGTVVLTGRDVNLVSDSVGKKAFLLMEVTADSVPPADFFIQSWDHSGKIPNFIRTAPENWSKAAAVILTLNTHPKIFGVVKNGDQLLGDVSWKDYPNRKTNGFFSFPMGTYTTSSLSPYKAGYQFSPDIILPSPENLRNLKVFNAVPLDPDFGLTDHYSFSNEVQNIQRRNDDEIITYGIDFVKDENRGNCAFFSGKAYLDGGLKSRSALKPNFSITAWIKPAKLGRNNCILGKGKDFVLKIHDGLLTLTVQGVKDYYSPETRIPIDQWTFISLVHNSADNQVSFYMNGELTEKISLLKPYTESDYTMLIGSNLWEEFFVGYIQEIKIWDRELNEDEVRNEFLSENHGQRLFSGNWFIWILLLAGVVGIVLMLKRKNTKRAEVAELSKPVQVPEQRTAAMPACSKSQEQVNCFGGLKVMNCEGKDISQKFSPKIKQLFVLIFLHSVPGQKGISSKKLSDCLWPGMSPQNAKNIRGTNIQNLKALLASCSEMKLVFQDKLWKLEFAEGYFADYAFVESRLDELETYTEKDKLLAELPELITILKRGTLFPNMSESWVDPYIDRMSNRIIEFGLNLFRLFPEGKYDALLLDLAEIISINDPLNEPSLRKKVGILTRQGKLSLAYSMFDNFTKLYFELYQEKYSGDFKSLIVSEPLEVEK